LAILIDQTLNRDITANILRHISVASHFSRTLSTGKVDGARPLIDFRSICQGYLFSNDNNKFTRMGIVTNTAKDYVLPNMQRWRGTQRIVAERSIWGHGCSTSARILRCEGR
jgi:hypothetical protein